MPALARRNRHRSDIWPGFVDALASLLMVIIFLLLVFVLAQFFLGEALSGRESALEKLDKEVAELVDLLALEKKSNANLRGDVSRLSGELQASIAETDRLKLDVENGAAEITRLVGDVVKLEALKSQLEADIGKLAAQVDDKSKALLAEQELSESARAEVALLNRQTAELRDQIAALNKALEASEAKAEEQNAQIVSLGKRLNAALASKVMELSAYRSEFFGRLAKILGAQEGIEIVGDRFVFQSELLFESGEARINVGAHEQLGRLAEHITALQDQIPEDIDWVLRVDGHTDRVPIKTAAFASNWELSTARAIEVVKFLIAQGVPPNRLVAAGFGEYQPLSRGATPEALLRNRRIELKLTQR
ncbi:MAG: peptidoglycan -binding protein [Alphaproteobacteria bacterium]|nr:peptidoglycan -binding protein [Alphaproteobacteria bacterium]MBF0249309.1 peptidoglycan -binding protein [Alphaproteobacteria bacterium]